MLNIVTCNPIRVKNLLDYHQNFILVHTMESPPVIPFARSSESLTFDVYHDYGMDLSSLDEYQDTNDTKFNFHEVNGITTGLDMITEKLVQLLGDSEEHGDNEDEDEDRPDESMVAVCCGYGWNPQVVRYLSSHMGSIRDVAKPIDLYRILHIPSEEKLKDYLGMSLGSRFIYMDDPVALGYAIYRTISGTFR